MADRFRSFDSLREALADRTFDRPPAFVCNAHITGLGVARALAAHDVPVVALDRTGDGVAPGSDAVTLAGEVSYPLADPEGFRDDVEELAACLDHAPVAFGCMDEWALGFARTEPEGVRLPFASPPAMDAVLDKESLYGVADELDVPHPETYRLAETVPEELPVHVERAPPVKPAAEAADELGFPLVLKPAMKREFEEATGTNVVEAADEDEFESVVADAAERGIRLMAQRRVDAVPGEDRSVVSYLPPEGEPLTFVGNPTRYPLSYGTSCLVEGVDDPELTARTLEVLSAAGYHGISEAEFVYDRDRESYLLLDVNTRPWKWIALPVAAGLDLPMAAYADAVGASYEPGPRRDARWVSLPDYLSLLAERPSFPDAFDRADWRSLVAGGGPEDGGVVPAVFDPADPDPAAQLIETTVGETEYYCSC